MSCPKCGYCEECGRSNPQPQMAPFNPWYPWYQPNTFSTSPNSNGEVTKVPDFQFIYNTNGEIQ